MKNLNTLPAPRSIADQFEIGTSFEYNIGDGDCIGGDIKGYKRPLYIDWDSENPTEYRIYIADTNSVFLRKTKKAQSFLVSGDIMGYVNATKSDIEHTVYSVEEAIETLKLIAK